MCVIQILNILFNQKRLENVSQLFKSMINKEEISEDDRGDGQASPDVQPAAGICLSGREYWPRAGYPSRRETTHRSYFA